jgi:hypothetical protein
MFCDLRLNFSRDHKSHAHSNPTSFEVMARRLSTVYDLADLRVHRSGSRLVEPTTERPRPRRSKRMVKDARGNWIAKDAVGEWTVKKRRSNAQSSVSGRSRSGRRRNSEGDAFDFTGINGDVTPAVTQEQGSDVTALPVPSSVSDFFESRVCSRLIFKY